jgi:RimJ/RimL family protein N-acetyltransferase
VLPRAAAIARTEGVRPLAMRVLGDTVYRRLRLVELPLQPPSPAAPAPAELSFGFLAPEELADYEALHGERVTARERLAAGERCFVARHEGRLVSTRWLAFGSARIDYLDRRLELGDRDVYLSETYTDPAVRGRGYSSAAGAAYARLLAAEGYARVVAAVLPENHQGRRAYEKAGYRPVGTIGWLGVGPLRRPFGRIAAD